MSHEAAGGSGGVTTVQLDLHQPTSQLLTLPCGCRTFVFAMPIPVALTKGEVVRRSMKIPPLFFADDADAGVVRH